MTCTHLNTSGYGKLHTVYTTFQEDSESLAIPPIHNHICVCVCVWSGVGGGDVMNS